MFVIFSKFLAIFVMSIYQKIIIQKNQKEFAM